MPNKRFSFFLTAALLAASLFSFVTAAPNPIPLTFTAGYNVLISAIANAGYVQRVDVTSLANGTIIDTFNGTGESQVMQTLKGKKKTLFIESPQNGSAIRLAFYFYYAKDGSNFTGAARVQAAKTETINDFIYTNVTSEDDQDDDDNDTVLATISYPADTDGPAPSFPWGGIDG